MSWDDLRRTAKQRIKFIDTRLFWEGKISRKDVTDYYDISIPQATNDFKQYIKLAPGNILYDKSEKQYVATPNFKPFFGVQSGEDYFLKLLTEEIPDGENRFYCGTIPNHYKIPNIRRKFEPNILKNLLKSIKNNNAIEIEYQSFNNPAPDWRWISPHALGFDGFRWHARALCHRSKAYKDFNLGRISGVRHERHFMFDHSNDLLWNHKVTFRIGPHPDLSESQKKFIEQDYGMTDGELHFEVKASFIFYITERFRIEEGHKERPAKKQQIILLNDDEIKLKDKTLKSIVSEKLDDILGEIDANYYQ